MELPILILAAGRSSRMRGIDKLTLTIDGTTVLRRQINAGLCATSRVFVALHPNDPTRLQQLNDTAARPLFAPHAGEGIGTTLRETVQQLPPCPAFMIVLADLIELQGTDFSHVLSAFSRQPNFLIWRGATAKGKAGHPIVFDASLRPAFANLSGDTGGAPILKAHSDRTCLVPLSGNKALLDLDTPEDWAEWRAKSGR